MATKPNISAFGSGSGRGGEKKASPSGTAAQPRKSPSTTKTTLTNSTSSKKLAPSNLKGTRNSEDVVPISKQLGKKPLSSESSAQKPVISRRSSFDKAQSPSATQISRNTLNPALRSQSFSGKSVGSPKSVPEKNLKAPIKDAGKPRSLSSKPVNAVKKTGMYVKKQGTETSSTSSRKEQVASLTQKGYNPIAVPDVIESEPLSENQESEGLVDSDGSNDEKYTEIPTPEYPEQIEAERNYNAKTVTVESPKVLEHEDVFIGVKTEEPVEEPAEEKTEEADAKSQIEETNSKQKEIEHYTNEINSNITDESVAGKPIEKAEEKEKEEEIIFDKKQEAASGSEATESMETEVQKVAEEEKKESEKAAAKPQVVAHGKKDVALSNDVIEETVSKLREQRKNKVRALAGAFETVISLQDK